jgi:hypothetical protein
MAVFQNGGLVATIAIFIPQWIRGEKLDESISISLMAMVYFIFLHINYMTYYAMTTIQTFLAIIERLASVFELDEYEFSRETDCKPEEAKLEIKGADFTWGFKIKTQDALKRNVM